VEDLQRKELEDQLEAEAYFSGLYKTQVLPILPVLPGISGSGSRIVFPKNSPFTEDQLEAEAYFSGLYKTQVLPVLPGISGSGSRIRIPLSPIKRFWRISWRPRPIFPAYTRPRYCQPYTPI
jgi:hypothetical protein